MARKSSFLYTFGPKRLAARQIQTGHDSIIRPQKCQVTSNDWCRYVRCTSSHSKDLFRRRIRFYSNKNTAATPEPSVAISQGSFSPARLTKIGLLQTRFPKAVLLQSNCRNRLGWQRSHLGYWLHTELSCLLHLRRHTSFHNRLALVEEASPNAAFRKLHPAPAQTQNLVRPLREALEHLTIGDDQQVVDQDRRTSETMLTHVAPAILGPLFVSLMIEGLIQYDSGVAMHSRPDSHRHMAYRMRSCLSCAGHVLTLEKIAPTRSHPTSSIHKPVFVLPTLGPRTYKVLFVPNDRRSVTVAGKRNLPPQVTRRPGSGTSILAESFTIWPTKSTPRSLCARGRNHRIQRVMAREIKSCRRANCIGDSTRK